MDKNTPKADIITDLLITVRDSLQGARSATFNKLASLDKDNTTSIRSKASHKTNRSNTSTSSGGLRSSKQTLISVKARSASLEQKIKFSDAIEEQQKALNKLKLQQRLSETLAEEAVYEKALKGGGHLFELEPELPHETEQMIDRFMTQSQLSTRPLSSTAGLVSAVNFDTGIPAAPQSGTGLPAASYPDTGIPFASYPGTGIPAAYNPRTELPTASYPDTRLPFAPDPSKGIPADYNPDTEFPAVSMPFSATSSTDTGIPITSYLDTGYPTASQFPALSAVSGNLNTSKLFVSHTTNSPTPPRLSTKTSTPVTASEMACGTIKPVASFPQEPLHTSLSWATSHHSPGAIRSMKPGYPSVYDLRPEADIFTLKASPGTVYHEFRPSPFPVSLNHPQPSTVSINQIAEALAKATRLQRLPQAKPSDFRGDEADTKFFIWETVFDVLIDSAAQRSAKTLSSLSALRWKSEKGR